MTGNKEKLKRKRMTRRGGNKVVKSIRGQYEGEKDEWKGNQKGEMEKRKEEDKKDQKYDEKRRKNKETSDEERIKG